MFIILFQTNLTWERNYLVLQVCCLIIKGKVKYFPGACHSHSLRMESEIEEQNNITFHRNCFDKGKRKY